MKHLTDPEIVEKLLERDPIVTKWFYYVKCRSLFLSLIKKLFKHPVEYDEFVNEVIVLLMERDEYRLRQFDYQSTICCWLRTCLIRHFIRNNDIMIEDITKEPPYSIDVAVVETISQTQAKIDMDFLLKKVEKKNKRHAFVIRRLILEDAEFEDVADELHVKVSNLYNIKKRAMEVLTEVALGTKSSSK